MHGLPVSCPFNFPNGNLKQQLSHIGAFICYQNIDAKNKLNLHIYGIHLFNPHKTVVSHLKTLSKRRHFHRVMMHKYLSGEVDLNFDIRRNSSFHNLVPRSHSVTGNTFIYLAFKDCNNLDNNIKSSESMSFFKAKLKSL